MNYRPSEGGQRGGRAPLYGAVTGPDYTVWGGWGWGGGAQGQKLAVGAMLAPAFHHSGPQGPGVNLAQASVCLVPHPSRSCVRRQSLCGFLPWGGLQGPPSTLRPAAILHGKPKSGLPLVPDKSCHFWMDTSLKINIFWCFWLGLAPASWCQNLPPALFLPVLEGLLLGEPDEERSADARGAGAARSSSSSSRKRACAPDVHTYAAGENRIYLGEQLDVPPKHATGANKLHESPGNSSGLRDGHPEQRVESPPFNTQVLLN